MELLDRLYCLGIVSRIREGVRALSQRLGQGPLADRLKNNSRRWIGAGLLIVSLTLGIWAYDLAEADALGGWLKTHPPSSLVWNHALLGRGYTLAKDPKALHAALRLLPSMIDRESAVWTTADTRWIAVYGREDQPAPVIYCLQCQKGPEGWSPAGVGWEAFDPVVARAEEAAMRARPAARPRAPAADPMELRF